MSPDLVVVSTDFGRAQMAASYAQCLGVPVVLLQKRRESGTKTEVTNIVGDVSGRSCVIVDDIISTGGTLAESIRALLRAGARPDIMVAATHGLLLSGAREKLDHPAVREVFVTDAVCVAKTDWPRLRVISIAPLIARALEGFLPDASRADLFEERHRGAPQGEKMHATILS
jgi:ribose-phosphate pyrophosphokinase